MRLTITAASLGAAAVLAAATGTPALAAATARPQAAATIALPGSVFAGLGNAKETGNLPATQRIFAGLVLQRPQVAEEQALNAAIYDKTSPEYHHFLTPATYRARFGLASGTELAARTFATAHGMSVVRTSNTGDVLFLSGTPAQAEATFGTTLHTYTYKGATFFANSTPVHVPSALPALGVIGLNNLLKSHTFSTTAPKKAIGPAALPAAAHPQQTGPCVQSRCTGLTTPQDMWSMYDQPSNNFGEGQKMAIFGEGQTDPVIANLRTFEGLNGLRRIPINVVHTDGADANYSDNSGEVEWDLDTQSSTGMSPNALAEDLYFGTDLTDTSTLSVLTAWVSTQGSPMQASASYGECEQNPTSPLPAPGTPYGGAAGSAGGLYTGNYEQELTEATSMGKTLFASTGDTGSSCPVVYAAVIGAGNGVANQGFPIVNYPASSPHVVAVGGTVLYGDGKTPAARQLEYAWTFTGGGASNVFPKPSYQSKISVITSPCIISPGGAMPSPAQPGTICRGIPDIAAQSGDVAGNGYAIVSQGQTNYPGGGTSLSSPMSMGMWTRVQSASRAGGNGFADTLFYAQAGDGSATSKDTNDFFDVGGPANSQPSGNGYYTAVPRNQADPTGWDYVSGLGVPDYAHVSMDVNGTTAPLRPALPPEAPLAGGGTTTTPVDPGCIPSFTDAAGDDAFAGDPAGGGSNPQLDILQGDMHFITLGGVPTLQTVLTMKNLTTTRASAGGAGNRYYFLWTYAGTQYFTSANIDTTVPGAAPTYGYGTVSGTQYTNGTGTGVTGAFNLGAGKTGAGSGTATSPGTAVVNVPLSNVGITAPSSLTTLAAPAGQTKVLVGTTPTGGLIEAVDSGSDNDQNFLLGESCQATGRPGTSGGNGTTGATATTGLPEAPYAVMLVLVGLSLGGLLLIRRRDARS